jgi:putative transposase
VVGRTRPPYPAELKDEFGWTIEIVRRAADAIGFVVQPKRWIVERTFAWFGRYRRLSKDYEENVESSEAWLFTAWSTSRPSRCGGRSGPALCSTYLAVLAIWRPSSAGTVVAI